MMLMVGRAEYCSTYCDRGTGALPESICAGGGPKGGVLPKKSKLSSLGHFWGKYKVSYTRIFFLGAFGADLFLFSQILDLI